MARDTVSLLSEIHDKAINWNVRVLLSRLWHYRGTTDHGPLLHTDLVVIDQEGTHMYAQLPPAVSERLADVLEEGKVYLLRKFLCNKAKPTYRAVESDYMIQFTRYTTAVLQPDAENTYPYCTYNLVPFADIPKPASNTPCFLDVVGHIKAVSEIVPVQSMYQPEPSDTLTILLADSIGNEIKLLLWGERAREFEAEGIRGGNLEGAVVAIFVGTLPKMSQGIKSLSGSAACRWYINEDLPEINALLASLGKEVAPVELYSPINQGIAASIREPPVEMNVKQLLTLDPFDNLRKPFICKVTITRLGSDQRWWFLSCGSCHKTSYVNGSSFRCSDHGCSSTEANPTYSICTFARDASAEAEFMFFEKSGRAATGKPLLTLLRQKYRGYSDVHELAQIGGSDVTLPNEITRMVAKTYRLVVAISNKSFKPMSTQLSFQVSRIDQTFQPELGPLEFPHASSSTTASSSGAALSGRSFIPPVSQLTPSSKSIHTSGTSTLDELNTPLAIMKGKGSASSAPASGKTPCPSNARRRLVLTPTKTIEAIQPTVGAASAGNNSTADSLTGASMPPSDDPALNSESIKPAVPAAAGENKSIANPTTATSMPIFDNSALNILDDGASISESDNLLPASTAKPKRNNTGGKSTATTKKAKQ